jgi:hypothetical protein
VQIVARPPIGGTRRYLARAIQPKLSWIRDVDLSGSRPAAEDTDGPAVIIVDDNRHEIVIQRPGTFGQAKRAAARFQRELDALGRTEFSRRYGLRLD